MIELNILEREEATNGCQFFYYNYKTAAKERTTKDIIYQGPIVERVRLETIN